MERRFLRRLALVYVLLTNLMVESDFLEEAGRMIAMAGIAAKALMELSRTWQKGINRVAEKGDRPSQVPFTVRYEHLWTHRTIEGLHAARAET